MKRSLLCTVLLAAVYLASCDRPKEYVEFPSRIYPAAPVELERAVRVFLSNNGDDSRFSFRARKYSDEIFLIKAATDKSEGWGLIAQKQKQAGQISWQIELGTVEKFNSLGIEPQW